MKAISSFDKTKIKFNVLGKNTIFLSLKTFNNYICSYPTKKIIFIDFNKKKSDFKNKLIFTQISSITKMSLENKEYLYISAKPNNKVFLIEDNAKIIKEEKILVDNSLDTISLKQLIMLDNKNLLIFEDKNKISYYLYNNDTKKYEKFFNNINKYGNVLSLHKVLNNCFCFLAYFGEQKLVFALYSENFDFKETIIEINAPICNVKNNIMFKICENKFIIIGRYEFIIFDIKLMEVNTIFKVGLICCILPFDNKMSNIKNNIYNYFALIIYDNDNFYLKIIKVKNDNIEETEKINLNNFSTEFESLIDKDNNQNNQILKFYKDIEKKNDEKINYHLFRDYDIDKRLKNDKSNEIYYFDMSYDLKDNGNIILIVDFIRLLGNKKLTILLNIDLNHLSFT